MKRTLSALALLVAINLVLGLNHIGLSYFVPSFGSPELSESENLEKVWAVGGGWTSVAVDAAGEIVVCRPTGFETSRFGWLAPEGKIESQMRVAISGWVVRPAQLDADNEMEYLLTKTWGTATAIDHDGSILWKAPGNSGVNDVWTADLTGDGLDEVIVGHNGGTGIHVFGSDGVLLWKNTTIGNVWHVTAADLDGDGRSEVLSTSARGNVHVFDAKSGKQTATMDSDIYFNMVRSAVFEGEPLVFAGGRGTSSGPRTVSCLAPDGQELWRFSMETDGQINDIRAARSRPWGVVSWGAGQILVFNLHDGSIIGRGTVGGRLPSVAWYEGGEEPILLIANGQGVVAARVVVPGLAESADR